MVCPGDSRGRRQCGGPAPAAGAVAACAGAVSASSSLRARVRRRAPPGAAAQNARPRAHAW
eukprot:3487690-Alexandrium_andersonii.AAC.1